MRIGPMNRSDINPEKVVKQQEIIDKKAPKEQKDTVEISKSGREKLKEIADSYHNDIGNDDDIIENISPKLARIRNKLEAGYYDLDEIQNKIVDKLTDTINNEIDNNKKME